jgi:membrane-associated phospholipid phosphatase
MKRGLVLAALSALAALAVARPALAGEPGQVDTPDQVKWDESWRRVQPWEIANAVALTVVDAEIATVVNTPSQPNWRGPILFDNWARNTFHGRTLSAQSTAETVSTDLYLGGSLVPLVVDDYIAALSIHQNADVALQMFAIDMEAFGVSGLLSLGAEHTVGRARPYTTDCTARDPSTGALLHQCGTVNDNASFFSGHAAATSTVAGLVCVDHQHLPLFGGGAYDLAPCLLMIANSLATGMLRLVADMHWASDVITGWVVGGVSGYVLPAALHYGFGDGHALEVRSGALWMMPTLVPYPAGAGAGVVGTF